MLLKVLEKIKVVSSSNGPTDPESVRPAEKATFRVPAGTGSVLGASRSAYTHTHTQTTWLLRLQILQLFPGVSQFDLELYRKQLITDCVNKADAC